MTNLKTNSEKDKFANMTILNGKYEKDSSESEDLKKNDSGKELSEKGRAGEN